MSVRNLDKLFAAKSIVLLGTATGSTQLCMLQNVRKEEASRKIVALEGKPDATRIASCTSPDLAVILEQRWGATSIITALGNRGCRAVIWVVDAPPALDVLKAASVFNLRILGPRTIGIFSAESGLNLTTLPMRLRRGKVALIAQSQSIAAAAMDWATGRDIGFSWLAVTGAEADIDVADLLDHAALDPATRAVILQVGRIRNGRKFMSAARAAARIKPVLVLQTAGDNQRVPSDPVRSAAFRRAGLVECESMGGVFDGLAALEMLAPPTGERVMVVANGAGVCALAGRAVVEQRLAVAEVSVHTQELISKIMTGVRFVSAGIDTGDASPDQLIAITRILLADSAVDTVMLVRSPLSGTSQQAMADALAKANLGNRVMTVWLGLDTALPAMHSSARAHLATFASAGDASRAVRYRLQHARTRELLMRTPPVDLHSRLDLEDARLYCSKILSEEICTLVDEKAQKLLLGYGLGFKPAALGAADIVVSAGRHHELGMWISVRNPRIHAAVSPAYGLPPLDSLLARRMLEESGYDPGTAPQAWEALCGVLIRLGNFIVDQPTVESVVLPLVIRANSSMQSAIGTSVALSRMRLPDEVHLALAPYPKRLEHHTQARNQSNYLVRAVLPSDEPRLLNFLEHLNVDEIRLRFFAFIRYFSHDMAARMTQIDYDREVTLVALHAEQQDMIVGIATIVSDPDGQEAEYAVLVHHDHARQGLGRHLLECLLQEARQRGISKVHGDVLADNVPMLNLVRSLGFTTHASFEDPGCRQVEIILEPDSSSQAVRC